MGLGDGQNDGRRDERAKRLIENDQNGWKAYLDEDEKILWTGQPQPGLMFKPSDLALSGFGFFFFAFAIFWTTMAGSMGSEAGLFGYIFPLFGVPFILVGGYLLFGRFFWDAYVRGKTRYALTNRRAIVAKSAFGRSMASHPITKSSEIELQVCTPDTVNFAAKFVRTKNGGHNVPVGFERIEDGATVYKLLREIKNGTPG